MNRSIIPFVVAGLGALWLAQPVMAAEPTGDTGLSKQAGETWKTIKSYSVEKKDEAVAYSKQVMKETDAKIEQIEAKAAGASGEAKIKYEEELAHLKVVRANTAAKLDKMEKATGGAWNDAKQGFADAYKDLQRAYDKAAAKFK